MVYKDPIEGEAIADLERANLSVKATVAKLQVMVIFQFVKKIIVSTQHSVSCHMIQCHCRILLLTYKSTESCYSQLAMLHPIKSPRQ